MPKPLSDRSIALVKASIPALEAHGLAITNRMYARMFEVPMIKAMFNAAHQEGAAAQPKAVAQAVLAYAKNIDNLGALGDAVERIAQKHTAFTIQPEHYPYVGWALLAAIKDVLGEAATPEILAAWAEAYDFLADIFINREATLYANAKLAPGGWAGWRDFVVTETQDESTLIRSFILAPADGGAVKRHRPGQYLGLRLNIPGQGEVRRNYSISCAPNDRAYRITVKREPGTPAGLVSNWLHDHAKPGTRLALAAPAGDFFLDLATDKPVVLLSGGVGLTPMISMLEAIVAERPDLPTWFVHAAQNGSVHAMGAHVRELARKANVEAANVHVSIFYAEPAENDRLGEVYEQAGFITQGWLAANTPVKEATIYLCGPKPFMRAMVRALTALGVEAAQIRYEFFGPTDEILLAA
jgi:nitric oxide dioxygenase